VTIIKFLVEDQEWLVIINQWKDFISIWPRWRLEMLLSQLRETKEKMNVLQKLFSLTSYMGAVWQLTCFRKHSEFHRVCPSWPSPWSKWWTSWSPLAYCTENIENSGIQCIVHSQHRVAGHQLVHIHRFRSRTKK
jgi:hypothetical protein